MGLIIRSERLNWLRDRFTTRRIVSLYGIPGTGKTSLAWSYFEHARNGSESILYRNGIFITFDPNYNTDQDEAVDPVQLTSELCKAIPYLAATQLAQPPESKKSLDEELSGVVRYYTFAEPQLNAPERYLIILDALNNVYEELWDWLRNKVIAPLLKSGHENVDILCTSNTELPWDHPEWKKNYIYEEPAPQFEDGEILDYLREVCDLPESNILARILKTFMGGYVFAFSKFNETLKQDEREDHPWTLGDVSTVTPQALSWSSLERDYQTVVAYSGLLRRPDMEVILDLLKSSTYRDKMTWLFEQSPATRQLVSQIPETLDFSKRVNLIRELRKSHVLVQSIRPQQPERFNANLRRLIAEELLGLYQDDRQGHAQVLYKCLADLYGERLRQQPLNEPQAMLDWLYFSALTLVEGWTPPATSEDDPRPRPMPRMLPDSHARQRAWHAQLEEYFGIVTAAAASMLSRSPNAELRLLAAFYGDDELLRHLNTLTCFPAVEKQFQLLLTKLQGVIANQDQSAARSVLEPPQAEFEGLPLESFERVRSKVLRSLQGRVRATGDYQLVADIKEEMLRPGSFTRNWALADVSAGGEDQGLIRARQDLHKKFKQRGLIIGQRSNRLVPEIADLFEVRHESLVRLITSEFRK